MAKEKKDRSSKGVLPIKARGISDNILFTKKNAYAGYRITNEAFDFLAPEAKISLAARTINAFNHIANDRSTPLDCKIIQTSNPVDLEKWVDQVYSLTDPVLRSNGFEDYMFKQREYLEKEEYTRKVSYLFIDLGRRGAMDIQKMNPIELGSKEALKNVKDWVFDAMKTNREEMTADEEEYFAQRQEAYAGALQNGALRARPMTAEEILLVIKRQFWPCMPAPYLDADYENRIGLGDIVYESGSVIDARNSRYIKISQMFGDQEIEGYRATLSIAKIPKKMSFPYNNFPFMYYVSKMQLPFTSFINFSFIPHAKVKKALEDKKKEQKDEFTNITSNIKQTDVLSGLPDAFQESLDDAAEISAILDDGNKRPWVDASYHIVVETPTVEVLKKYCDLLIQKFKDQDISLKWTAGDQIDLFLAQMPGDGHDFKDFVIRNDLNILGIAGINYSSEIGDLIEGEDA